MNSVKSSFIATMLLATVPALAQQAAPAPTLVPGSAVKLEAVTAAKWIQGEPPKAFEPGKVYMFECWATWCGPCVAAIPHVNELHKKYHDKGLRVYGMNVLEDGVEKVENFLKGKGDGMSYPVAYTGEGSAFEKDWLVAAGVRGIPRALIVVDGKLTLSTHPAKITDSLIEALLAGGETAKNALDEEAAQEIDEAKLMSLMREFYMAFQKSDAEAMEKILKQVEAIEPKAPRVPNMKACVLIARKDFAAAITLLDAIKDENQRRMSYGAISQQIAMEKDPGAYPADFVRSVIAGRPVYLAPVRPMEKVILSILQWKAGDKEAALKLAKESVEAASEPGPSKMPAVPFEKFVKAMEEGNMPALSEVYQWFGR